MTAPLEKRNVLVIGKGGREHALVWKLAQSPHVGTVFCAPGNSGTAIEGTNVPIDYMDYDRLIRFCIKEQVKLVVIGPEDPLAFGLSDQLRNQWSASGTTQPVGPFRLRYTLERERSILSGPASGMPVDGQFRYSATGWVLEPLAPDRGEPVEKALAAGSDFRKAVDAIDPGRTAVTLWVYPDSFVLYRRLRDYLHDREIVVAGRPLAEGLPIATSSQGTTSRGQ